LVRIRAEGELDFDYSIEGNLLTVEVEGPVPEPLFRAAPHIATA